MNSDSTNKASNQMKDIFKNVKSSYILEKLFDNLERKKLLDIIKYNKDIKRRMNININNYKEYSELYSSIELEIITKLNGYGHFLYVGGEYGKYFHIYFNDNKEEIKRNYIKKDDKVRKIKIIIDSEIKSFSSLFFECKCIESINFKKFFRKNITNMYGMFCRCLSLKELNLNNFNTNNVTDMGCMFKGCPL